MQSFQLVCECSFIHRHWNFTSLKFIQWNTIFTDTQKLFHITITKFYACINGNINEISSWQMYMTNKRTNLKTITTTTNISLSFVLFLPIALKLLSDLFGCGDSNLYTSIIFLCYQINSRFAHQIYNNKSNIALR